MASKRLSQEEIANQKAERIMNGVATWCSYYRANPHRFCKDYLGLNLKLFQKILIFMMNISDAFMFIAARGLGKTYLTAIYCCVRAILYPGTIICIASGARSQAVGVLEKITNLLMPDSGNLRFEIETSVINQQMAFIKFKNSSMIKVVTAADSARGNRAHIIIVDEFRLVSREVIDKVKIKKMSPDELVEVKSNFYGTLFYKSKVTGFECEWSNCGDVNLLTIAELQNMRNGQRDFFSENWVMLVGDNAEQALDWLQIRKYYSDIVELDDLDEVFTWSPEKIETVVTKIARGAKDSIAMRAYDLIESGSLDSIKTIKAIEAATGYVLMEK